MVLNRPQNANKNMLMRCASSNPSRGRQLSKVGVPWLFMVNNEARSYLPLPKGNKFTFLRVNLSDIEALSRSVLPYLAIRSLALGWPKGKKVTKKTQLQSPAISQRCLFLIGISTNITLRRGKKSWKITRIVKLFKAGIQFIVISWEARTFAQKQCFATSLLNIRAKPSLDW